MRFTTRTREALRRRRIRRDLLRRGYEEVGERGGELWQLHRGCRMNQIIVDAVVGPEGKSIFIKAAPVFPDGLSGFKWRDAGDLVPEAHQASRLPSR